MTTRDGLSTVDDHRRRTEEWRAATMTERGLDAELEAVLDDRPAARATLRLLAECNDLDLLYELVDDCIKVEAAYPSQGWRIAWIQAAERGMARTLATKHSMSEEAAVQAYWTAAAGFAARVASNPDKGVEIPDQGVNIGWILGTGPADAVRDAFTVVGMESLLALIEAD